MPCGVSGSLYDLTGNSVSNTFGRVVQVIPGSSQPNTPRSGSFPIYDGYGNKITGLSLDEVQITGSGLISGDLTVGGTITAQEFRGELISSSIIYESGSTKFGDSADDLHERTGSLSISGSITHVDSIQFDTELDVLPEIGELLYNSTDGTLDLGINGSIGNATLQLGQELLYPYCVNGDSVDLPNGTLVMVVPTDPVQGQRVKIQRAITDGTYPSALLVGVTTEAIAQNQQGFVSWFGYVRDIDTTELESLGFKDTGQTWLEGQILYPDPIRPGGMTNSKPASPNLKSEIALVIRVLGKKVKLLVRPNLGHRIEDLYDVDDVDKDQGALLTYNSGSRVWETKNSLVGDYQITGSIRISGSISGELRDSYYRLKRTFVTSSYIVDPTDYLIGVSTVSGSVTLSFPPSSDDTYSFIIKDEGYNINNEEITITSIDPNDRFENNEMFLTLNENGTSVTLYSNGSGTYYII